MAADLTEYGKKCHALFLVYDPKRSMRHDEKFKSDFESLGPRMPRVLNGILNSQFRGSLGRLASYNVVLILGVLEFLGRGAPVGLSTC